MLQFVCVSNVFGNKLYTHHAAYKRSHHTRITLLYGRYPFGCTQRWHTPLTESSTGLWQRRCCSHCDRIVTQVSFWVAADWIEPRVAHTHRAYFSFFRFLLLRCHSARAMHHRRRSITQKLNKLLATKCVALMGVRRTFVRFYFFA